MHPTQRLSVSSTRAPKINTQKLKTYLPAAPRQVKEKTRKRLAAVRKPGSRDAWRIPFCFLPKCLLRPQASPDQTSSKLVRVHKDVSVDNYVDDRLGRGEGNV